jgi:AAA domain
MNTAFPLSQDEQAGLSTELLILKTTLEEIAVGKRPPSDIADATARLVAANDQYGKKAKVAAVDAADWLETDPPPTNPILDGLFDAADKVEIVGSSKSRKTFFALDLAFSLSAGRRSFLDWKILRAFRVLVIQMEVKPAHYQRRVYRMARRMGITREDLAGRLVIINGRGQHMTPSTILELAREHCAELVVIDPVYKLLAGDANENDGAAWRPILAAFDRIAEQTGAAVIYVHHNSKGRAGDRDARDRGAGSGIVARDYDAAIYLTEHRDDADALVVQTLARNYPPREPFAIRWDDHVFEMADDVAPVEKTSSNAKTKTAVPDIAVFAAVGEGEKTYSDLVAALRGQGYARDASKVAIARTVADGVLTTRRERTFPKRTFYRRPTVPSNEPTNEERD